MQVILGVKIEDDIKKDFEFIVHDYYRTTISYKTRELIVEFIRAHKLKVQPYLLDVEPKGNIENGKVGTVTSNAERPAGENDFRGIAKLPIANSKGKENSEDIKGKKESIGKSKRSK